MLGAEAFINYHSAFKVLPVEGHCSDSYLLWAFFHVDVSKSQEKKMKVILEWKINPLIGLCLSAVMSIRNSTVSLQVVPSVIPGCGRQEDSRGQSPGLDPFGPPSAFGLHIPSHSLVLTTLLSEDKPSLLYKVAFAFLLKVRRISSWQSYNLLDD